MTPSTTPMKNQTVVPRPNKSIKERFRKLKSNGKHNGKHNVCPVNRYFSELNCLIKAYKKYDS